MPVPTADDRELARKLQVEEGGGVALVGGGPAPTNHDAAGAMALNCSRCSQQVAGIFSKRKKGSTTPNVLCVTVVV